MYGKFSSPPLTPEIWWGGLINDTFLHAGVSASGSSLLVAAAPLAGS